MKGDITLLCQKGKRRRPRETRGRFNKGKTIQQRPKEVRKHHSTGHRIRLFLAEGNESLRSQSARLATTLPLQPNRTSASLEKAFGIVSDSFPKGTFQTTTVDCGKEFACYERLESEYGLDIYFADPYSSWQRGTNENANGLLREFFSKG